jgi:hypothetical protein
MEALKRRTLRQPSAYPATNIASAAAKAHGTQSIKAGITAPLSRT